MNRNFLRVAIVSLIVSKLFVSSESFSYSAPTPTPNAVTVSDNVYANGKDAELIPSQVVEEAQRVLWIMKADPFVDPQGYRYEFKEFKGIFEQHGAVSDVVVAVSQTITLELLQPYDAVIFGDTHTQDRIQESESTAIQNFVKDGGSILILSKPNLWDGHGIQESISYTNSISQSFGIHFLSEPQIAGECLVVEEDHPLFDFIYIESAGAYPIQVEPPAKTIVQLNHFNYGKYDVLAAVEVGMGRVVASGFFNNLLSGELTSSNNLNNFHEFAENLVLWLLHKEDEINNPSIVSNQPHFLWKGKLYGAAVLELHQGAYQFNMMGVYEEFRKDESAIFSENIPLFPVNMEIAITRGEVFAKVIEQPRLENNFTAKIGVQSLNGGKGEIAPEILVVVSWGQEVTPVVSPTPTPIHYEYSGPSPTPVTHSPNVLWLAIYYNNDLKDLLTEKYGATHSYIIPNYDSKLMKMSYKLSDLMKYDLIVFYDTSDPMVLTQEEQKGLVDYVLQGGSILFASDFTDMSLLDYKLNWINSVAQPFGLQYVNLDLKYTSRELPYFFWRQVDHPLLTGVQRLAGNGYSKIEVRPPAQALAYDREEGMGKALLAIANIGFGRVVAFAERDPFNHSKAPETTVEYNSRRQLADNIAAWLFHREQLDIPTMTPTPTATGTATPLPTFDPSITPSPTPVGVPVNLLERYPTTLTEGDVENPREWSFTVDDIFYITHFHYDYHENETLKVQLGPAYLGVGHCPDGAVVGIVVPLESGLVESSLLPESEKVKHIWLRFHPSDINNLFPPGTVFETGHKDSYSLMQKIIARKLRNSWHDDDLVQIPPVGSVTIDMDTEKTRRFFYLLDGILHYVPDFEGLAVTDELESDDYGDIFDYVWKNFDRFYPMFVLLPEVDWNALRETYYPQADAAEDEHELVYILSKLLKPLKDLHNSLTIDEKPIVLYSSNFRRNYNPSFKFEENGIKILGELNYLKWGISNNNTGYVRIFKWGDSNLPKNFDLALESLRETDGLIVDVRVNGGGSENLAREVAGRFADKNYIYAYHQYRSGPDHTDLGVLNVRTLVPRTDLWRYDKPVITLIGQRCMSSNESFIAMMGECPNVTLMGDRTRGASGNPTSLELPYKITIVRSRWIDYLPDGTPLERHGVYPDIWFEGDENSFYGDRDDLLTAALARLSSVGIQEWMLYENGR